MYSHRHEPPFRAECAAFHLRASEIQRNGTFPLRGVATVLRKRNAKGSSLCRWRDGRWEQYISYVLIRICACSYITSIWSTSLIFGELRGRSQSVLQMRDGLSLSERSRASLSMRPGGAESVHKASEPWANLECSSWTV